MKRHKPIEYSIIALFLLIVLPAALGAGICTLDKASYKVGEIATLECSCSVNNEKNDDGFITWFWQNGTIARQTAVNSGDCAVSIFGDALYLDSSFIDNNVTVNWTEDAAVTYQPLGWGGSGDFQGTTFQVSGNYSDTDCLFTQIAVSNPVQLGKKNGAAFVLVDAKSYSPIINANCYGISYDAQGVPHFVAPDSNRYEKTGVNGVGYLFHDFEEKSLQPKVTYDWDLACFCDNTTGCINQSDSAAIELKHCSLRGLYTTAGRDARGSAQQGFYIMIGVLALAAFLVYMASTLGENHVFWKILAYFAAMFLLMFYAGGALILGSSAGHEIATFGLYKAVMWLIRLFVLYAFLYIMYNWLEYLGKLPKWAQRKNGT